jgi:hypothetical protein
MFRVKCFRKSDFGRRWQLPLRREYINDQPAVVLFQFLLHRHAKKNNYQQRSPSSPLNQRIGLIRQPTVAPSDAGIMNPPTNTDSCYVDALFFYIHFMRYTPNPTFVIPPRQSQIVVVRSTIVAHIPTFCHSPGHGLIGLGIRSTIFTPNPTFVTPQRGLIGLGARYHLHT